MKAIRHPNAGRGIDFIGIGTVALIHDGQGHLLLQKRGPKARDEQGRWDVCGGSVEFSEHFEDTLRREVKEELSSDILEMQFLTVYDAHRELSDGTPTHWVQIIYAVRVDPEKVKIGEPHKISELGWFTSKTLPTPLHSQFQKSFQPAMQAGIVV